MTDLVIFCLWGFVLLVVGIWAIISDMRDMYRQNKWMIDYLRQSIKDLTS